MNFVVLKNSYLSRKIFPNITCDIFRSDGEATERLARHTSSLDQQCSLRSYTDWSLLPFSQFVKHDYMGLNKKNIMSFLYKQNHRLRFRQSLFYFLFIFTFGMSVGRESKARANDNNSTLIISYIFIELLHGV